MFFYLVLEWVISRVKPQVEAVSISWAGRMWSRSMKFIDWSCGFCEEDGERRHLEIWLGDSESGLLCHIFHCVLFPEPGEVCRGHGCFTALTLARGLSPCFRSLPPCLSPFLINISWCLKPISKYLFILKMWTSLVLFRSQVKLPPSVNCSALP